MNSNILHIPIGKDNNPDDWYFEEKTNQFSPEIKLGDMVYINKTRLTLEDGKVYLLFHKQRENEYIIRRVSHNMNGTLKIKTPYEEEDTTEEQLLHNYYIYGQIQKSVRMVVQEF